MSHTPIFYPGCPCRLSSGKKIAKEQNLFALSLQKSLEKGICEKPFLKVFSPFSHFYFLNVT